MVLDIYSGGGFSWSCSRFTWSFALCERRALNTSAFLVSWALFQFNSAWLGSSEPLPYPAVHGEGMGLVPYTAAVGSGQERSIPDLSGRPWTELSRGKR